MAAIDYDSTASVASDDEDAFGGHDEENEEDDVFKDLTINEQQRRPSQGSRLEQLDPGSYAWALMRYAVVKMANHNLREFFSVAGIELQDEGFLILQEGVVGTTPGGEGDDRSIDGAVPDPVRIIHKDQESISAFCISQANEGILSLATPKELQELDISALLEPAPWLDDEAEFDILTLNRPPEPAAGQALDFLVVQHPLDRHNTSAGLAMPTASAFTSPTSANPPPLAAQTGRATTMMKGLNFPGSTNAHFCQIVLERSRLMIKPLKRHRVDSVRRLASHPVLPLYLSGCQDGSVSLWEWGHSQPVSTPRLAGTFAKVTSLLFNQQGNKFGVTDGDGNLSLWQVSMTSTNAKPFFSASCHSKQASDFAFVSSSSLIATAGHSAENRNVCLWDTLLPQRKALVACGSSFFFFLFTAREPQRKRRRT
ncbi:hypothetical protein V5799_013430 [Amblyomma americanum]|uniref:Uncharacterized protein n=1 Tax=Amblyomma americanum TaxID=6943 RepID=A0AAQ4E5X3_AMBAM